MADGVVGEAEDAVARRLQQGVPLRVVLLRGGVDGAVELEDEAAVGAAEVGDEGPDWVLAAELQAVQAAGSQRVPEDDFNWRLAGAARGRPGRCRGVCGSSWT